MVNKILVGIGISIFFISLLVGISFFAVQQSIKGQENIVVKKASYVSAQCRLCGDDKIDTRDNPILNPKTVKFFTTQSREVSLKCSKEQFKDQEIGDLLKGCEFYINLDKASILKYKKCSGGECDNEVSISIDKCDIIGLTGLFKSGQLCTANSLDPLKLSQEQSVIIKVHNARDLSWSIVASKYCLLFDNPLEGQSEFNSCNVNKLKDEFDGILSKADKGKVPTSGVLGENFQIQKFFYGYISGLEDPKDLMTDGNKMVFLIRRPTGIYACDVDKDEKDRFVVNDDSCSKTSKFECVPSEGNCDPYTGKIVKAKTGASCQVGQPPEFIHVYKGGKFQLCEFKCVAGSYKEQKCNVVRAPKLVDDPICPVNENYDIITKKCYKIQAQNRIQECQEEGGTWKEENEEECKFLCSIGLQNPTITKTSYCSKPNYIPYFIIGGFILVALLLITQPKNVTPKEMR